MITWENSGIEPGRFILEDGFDGVLFSDVDMGVDNSLDLSGRQIKMLKLSYRGGASVITDYELLPNYPNPFNMSTKITYMLKDAGRVQLSIFNVLGQKVKTLVDVVHNTAGKHTVVWDGTNDAGNIVSGGVYIYTMKINGIIRTEKLVLIK